jgi:hypothetical protein
MLHGTQRDELSSVRLTAAAAAAGLLAGERDGLDVSRGLAFNGREFA